MRHFRPKTVFEKFTGMFAVYFQSCDGVQTSVKPGAATRRGCGHASVRADSASRASDKTAIINMTGISIAARGSGADYTASLV